MSNVEAACSKKEASILQQKGKAKDMAWYSALSGHLAHCWTSQAAENLIERSLKKDVLPEGGHVDIGMLKLEI